MPEIKLPIEKQLIKRLVSDIVTFELNIPDVEVVELFSNINYEEHYIPMVKKKGLWVAKVKLTQSGVYWWKVRAKIEKNANWQWVLDAEGNVASGEIQADPFWLSQAIVYNVFVRFFKGKTQESSDLISPGEGGSFDDVKAHLDELKSLGINVLYFNPIHLIGELYRKYNIMDQLPGYLQPGSPYSIKDYKSIDPELTYDKDTKKHLLSDPQQEFRDLINAAHDRGMFVIMDVVFNHTAHDFIFQRIRPEWYLYKDNITSHEDPYLYPEDIKAGKPWGDPKHTVAPFDHGVWWEDAAQLNWEYMIPNTPNQPPPNTSLDEMWEYFISIPKYWVRHFGVDGFRCDIAYRVPSEFWKKCITETRKEARKAKTNLSHDVVFIAEAYTNSLKELQEAGFAAVYGDFSHKLARPIELHGYLQYMYNISGDHFPDGSKWFIFPESHDFGRTPMKILGNRAGERQQALLANQSRWLLTATLPGIPLIFNGFEKIEWQPLNLFSYGAVDWERDSDLRDFISNINAIRHNHPALRLGEFQHIPTNQGLNDETQLYAFLRTYVDKDKSEEIIVVVNMDVDHNAGPAVVYLPDRYNTKYVLTDLLTGNTYERENNELIIMLEPGQGHIFLAEFNE